MEMFEKEEIEKKLEEILEPFLKEEGFSLVDINWKGIGRSGKIEVFVDKNEGVTAEDTKKLAEEILEILHIREIPLDYILEVSSPGLDRILKKKREFKWACGKKVKVIHGEGKEEKGILVFVNDEKIGIEKENEIVYIFFNEIKKVQLMEWENYGKY